MEDLTIDVHRSAAGYYIGSWCGCGPYSRESDYYPTHEAASKDLPSYRPRHIAPASEGGADIFIHVESAMTGRTRAIPVD